MPWTSDMRMQAREIRRGISELRDKGFAFLRTTRYHLGNDPEALFEFEFIDKLAWAIHESTDAIIGPAIKFD